jgi:lipopolysaccharide export system protein LptA
VRGALPVVVAAAALSAAALAGAAPSRPATAAAGPSPAAGTKQAQGQPVTVDSDRMERFGKERLVIFTGNVAARHNDSVQYADRMEVYQDEKGTRVLRTVSTGNVRIVMRDGQAGAASRAEYHDLEQRVVLSGHARVWQDDTVVSGESIVIDIAQDRAVAHAGTQERVKTLVYPRADRKAGEGDVAAAASPPSAGLPGAGGLAAQPPRAAVPATPSGDDKARPRGKEDRGQPVTVDSDKMERFGKESLIIFTGNVVARQNNSVQYADRMEVYQDEKGDRILRTVSTGNVRIITSDCRTGTARRAEYYDLDQRVVLTGNARVWQEDNVVSGESIVIYLSQDRSIVQGGKQERVKAVFYPKDDKKDGTATAKAPAPRCAN